MSTEPEKTEPPLKWTKQDILSALWSIKPGQGVIYHHGYLARDRGEGSVREVANVALDMYRDGKVHLTQRKNGYSYTGWPEYDYIATGAL